MGKKIDELNAIASGSIVQADDLVAVFDLSANLLKKISVEDFASIVGSGFDINALSAINFADLTSGDTIPVYDTGAAATKKVTVQFLFDYVTKNANSLSTIASGGIVQANDFIFVYDASLGNLVKLSVSDFLSLAGGGLTHWTELSGSNIGGSDIWKSWVATGADTNLDAIITPKGSGAIRTSMGGQDRGTNAVDLQVARNDGSYVASADYSGITNGYDNTVGSAASYARAGGRFAYAKRFGEDAWASASTTSGPGTGQMSKMVFMASVTGNTDTELSADSLTTKRISLDNPSVMRVVVDTIALCTAQGNGTVVAGETYSSSIAFVVRKTGGSSTVVGSAALGATIEGTSMADTDISMDIDVGTQDAMIIFTPPALAGTTSTFRVVASVHITELSGN